MSISADVAPWPKGLHIRLLTGAPRIWEVTWSFASPDRRAAFASPNRDGDVRVAWRRVGDDGIYRCSRPAPARRPSPEFSASRHDGRASMALLFGNGRKAHVMEGDRIPIGDPLANSLAQRPRLGFLRKV